MQRATMLLLILATTSIPFDRCTALSFSPIVFPGASHTYPAAIDGDTIVGTYQLTASGPWHGFVYNGLTYSPLDYPGALFTTLTGVERNRIVGSYRASDRQRGFVVEDGVFTTIDPPLTSNLSTNGSEAHGIYGDRIVGGYMDDQQTTHGFVFDRTAYVTIDHPESAGLTTAVDIEGMSIVGSFVSATGHHGYVFDGATFTTLDAPFAGTTATVPIGVSGSIIVGYYAAPEGHGFIFDGSTYKTIDVPTMLGNHTILTGISGDRLVGHYIDSMSRTIGFVAIIPEPSSTQLIGVGILAVAFVARATRYFSGSLPYVRPSTPTIARRNSSGLISSFWR